MLLRELLAIRTTQELLQEATNRDLLNIFDDL